MAEVVTAALQAALDALAPITLSESPLVSAIDHVRIARQGSRAVVDAKGLGVACAVAIPVAGEGEFDIWAPATTLEYVLARAGEAFPLVTASDSQPDLRPRRPEGQIPLGGCRVSGKALAAAMRGLWGFGGNVALFPTALGLEVIGEDGPHTLANLVESALVTGEIPLQGLSVPPVAYACLVALPENAACDILWGDGWVEVTSPSARAAWRLWFEAPAAERPDVFGPLDAYDVRLKREEMATYCAGRETVEFGGIEERPRRMSFAASDLARGMDMFGAPTVTLQFTGTHAVVTEGDLSWALRGKAVGPP